MTTNGGITMAAYQFSAKIEHTEKTIESLYKAQYHAYEKPKMLLWLAVGFAMIFVAAFSALPTWAKALLLLIGGWVVVSIDFPSQIRADRALEVRKADLPKMEYEFHKDQMKISGEGSMSIPYKKIVRLTEDKYYFYIIFSKDSICMIDKSTVRPKSEKELKEFLAEKTNLYWQNEKSFLTMNLADVMLIINNRKK